MLTIVAFIVALGLLITVHEYGHYRVAVACGVKVKRFGVATLPFGAADSPSAFGRFMWLISKPVYAWKPKRQHRGQDTELAIGLFPFGGYVQMLDEREGPVPAEERHRAFNTQPLRSRFAIVAAGPIANLLLAIVLYAAVNWIGVQEPVAILARPAAATLAEEAGLRGGEHVTRAGLEGDELTTVDSFEDLRWRITRGALDGRDLMLEVAGQGGQPAKQVLLPLSRIGSKEADLQMFRKIGVMVPFSRPEIGEVFEPGAAQRAGLRSGDKVLAVGDTAVFDGQQLRETIRILNKAGEAPSQPWRIERAGQALTIDVKPDVVKDKEGAASAGRINALIGASDMVLVRQGLVDGAWRGVVRTWEVSALTVRMMGRMLIGQASIKNLSGPLTIAEVAGKSASLGLTQYLTFLALISVSLGVLNLLPIPVLDGGHLMYYLWEGLTGKGVSDAWMEWLQRGGLAILLVMMSIALFNDTSSQLSKLFG